MSLTLRKRGQVWHARGTIPARQANGSIVWVRHEESLRTESKSEARKRANEIEAYYRRQAYEPPQRNDGVSFAQAALTYLQTRGKDDRFLPRLLSHLGETPIGQINQAVLASTCHALYPGCSPSTHNRAVYAPVITILRLSGVRPDLRRPKIPRTQIDLPPDGWLDGLLPHCPPKLAALLIFITLTGRRITEALMAVSNGDGTAIIGRSKNGTAVLVGVPDMAIRLLEPLSPGERLFPYGDRHNVYRALRAACKRAVVPYYGTHSIGRHTFATRLIKEGFNTFTVAKMGGWASTRMVEYHYGHLAHDETKELLKEAQERWSGARAGQKPGKLG